MPYANNLITNKIMKKVLLSDSGPETSEAIYSFWRWNNNEDLNLAKIQDVLEYVISLGINALDVSSIYGNGKIQELLGDALANLTIKREDLVLFSKISNKHPQLDGNYQYEPLTEKSILKQVDTLLSSLKTDYIDVLLIEDFDPLMNVDVVASVLTSLRDPGDRCSLIVTGPNPCSHIRCHSIPRNPEFFPDFCDAIPDSLPSCSAQVQ